MDVMENLKRVHDSIEPPICSPASSLNLSWLVRWAAVSGIASGLAITAYLDPDSAVEQTC